VLRLRRPTQPALAGLSGRPRQRPTYTDIGATRAATLPAAIAMTGTRPCSGTERGLRSSIPLSQLARSEEPG